MLAIKEAVRTSVFSSRWKDKWAMLSRLVFDRRCCSTREGALTFVNIVDHVLLCRLVPIRQFVLSCTPGVPSGDIDRWVLHTLRSSTEVFELHISYWPENSTYKMPLCFFSYRNMVELKLSNCLLKPPTKFKGFRTLKRVAFHRVTLTQDVLENLIPCCPLLESLEMISCTGFTHLKINAPNLRFLKFFGDLQGVVFRIPFNFSVVSFHVVNFDTEDCDTSSNLAKFFIDLSHIQRLTLGAFAVEFLAVDLNLPRRLPRPCQDLSFLCLTVYFHDLYEILTTLYILSMSPALEELDVKVHYEGEVDKELEEEEANSWLDDLDDVRYKSFSFPKLRLVQITQFSGCKAEVDFIKYLLLNSPVLETMTIRALSAGTSEVFKKLLQLRRTSSAEIIYLDSTLDP